LPFQIAVLNEDRTGPPVYADGVVVQEQLLPKWLLKLLLALLAAALVLFILWQTVFKSVIESTAKDAVKPQVAAAAEAANQAKTAQQGANDAATKAAGSATQAADSAARAGGGGTTTTTTTVPGSIGQGGVLAQGTPAAFRLTSPSDALPGAGFKESPPAPIPAGKQLLVTDVVFENSAGDTGTFQVKRGGDVVFDEGLNNFRDLDFHFVTPIVVDPGQSLTIAVACETTVKPGSPCTASAYFGGVNRTPSP
jgi:hypothetical protein